jgi:hypothetical protein
MQRVTDKETLKFLEGSQQSDSGSFLDKAGNYASKFNRAVETSRLPSMAGGFLQSAGDMGASILNVPLGIVGAPKVPHPDLQKYLPQDLLSRGAFLGGELGGGLGGWLKTQKVISKLLPEMKRLSKLAKESLSGLMTGGLIGEDSEGNGRALSSALGSIAIPAAGIKKSGLFDYVSPEKMSKESERFRKSLANAETESENIENLSKRVKFAEESGKREALPLKKKLYSEYGKKDVYKTPKENLPEGNIEKFAYLIEPGFEESQVKALQSALKDFRKGKITEKELALPATYRKRGGEENFIEKVSDIFGQEEFTPSMAKKIEDALSIPVNKESKYFSNKKVTRLYDSDLKNLHKEYKESPTLENYDKLQSAIKKEMRSLKREGKMDSKARRNHIELQKVASDLNKDKDSFMSELPEEFKNLENEFRSKWAAGPAKYSSEAKLTLQRLASGSEGKLSQVTSNDVVKLFTKPDENTLEVIKQLGPSVGGNIIHSALTKVKPGDYEKMAENILNLSKTKGFERFISKDMIDWANNMKKRSKVSSLIKKSGTTAGGAIAGGLVGGPIGGVVGGLAGALSPLMKEYIKGSKFLKK